MKRELSDNLWLIAAPCVGIFGIIPFELYYNQRAMWDYSTELPLVIAAAGGVLCFILAFITILITKYYPKQSRIWSVALLTIGMYVLLADIFSPLQLNVLDGHVTTSDEPLAYTIREAVFALLLLSLLYFIPLERFILNAKKLSKALTAITALYLILILLPPPAQTKISRSADTPVPEGNIYHILLDEMQSDAALIRMSNDNIFDQFDGFTLFPNNTSNYLFTNASLPSYLTGTIYNGQGPFKTWQMGFKERGVLPTLHDAGYEVTFYSPRLEWDSSYIDHFLSYDQLFNRAMGHVNSQYREFIRLWFARLMPNAATNFGLRVGQLLANKFYSTSKGTLYYPDLVANGREPYTAAMMLKYAIEEERKRPANGQYVYMHAIMPHGPYVMREDCRYDSSFSDQKTHAYYQQSGCAMKLTVEFLKTLKELGRYDSSTIIIHADTGHGHFGYIKPEENSARGTSDKRKRPARAMRLKSEYDWSKAQLYSRTMALLMIKPRLAHGPLQFSNRKSQLIDLYPTLVDMLKLKNDTHLLPGFSLFGPTFPTERAPHFFLYEHQEREPKMTEYKLENAPMFARMEHWLIKNRTALAIPAKDESPNS